MSYNKYYKQKKQISYDYGQTWQDITPYQYQRGALYEEDSPDCQQKLLTTYSNGQTYYLTCDGNATLTTGDTNPSGYESSAMTSAVIGNCVTNIGEMAFRYCFKLTGITIPNSVTSIGDSAFYRCSGFTSITIPDSVTSIGNGIFSWCSSLTSVTVEATTPPTLGSSAFNETNNCPIYVPANSVDAYKTAENWSNYASRIQAKP